ncbi:DUF3696 domain-containing protein [Conexibacter sp. JD483]|uniref:AAA family ATPase n=1 Tax=unclassified Conexibacter TaxID=2627773 RepID=UPI0027243A15|nr:MULTISPECIES: DUF3696 domain-containing protein [unclassified Conexibacter]MDO8184015.1 DUF3696 domain-containing protein [Conexibacter sp. CPCC 205706]MDO8197007.1 DUF3696 domain-containing protein [Conexibacter sp. CPCC 205762]MDR9367923.1 DUF3696 domain-containing protein [Conexibacter sp. JD483]
MLTKLEIEGLKAFADRTSVELAPITLVFGDNSAGKSSLLQSLLVAQQTICSARDGRLRTSGHDFDLGGFTNLVHAHDCDRLLVIGCTVTGGRDFRDESTSHSIVMNFRAGDHSTADVDELRLSWHGGRTTTGLVFRPIEARRSERERQYDVGNGDWSPELLEWLKVVLGPRLAGRQRAAASAAWRTCREAAIAVARLDETAEEWDGFTEQEIERALGLIRPRFSAQSGSWLPRGVTADSLPRGSEATAVAAVVAALEAVIGQAHERLQDELGRVVHLGPAREIPQRVTLLRDASPEIGRLVHDAALLDRVNKYLRHLEIPYDLVPALLGRGDALLEDAIALRLIDHRYQTALTVNLRDVGVGISQLLPVVVSAVTNPFGAVFIEQPELHVHPGLQAKLGDVLVSESATTQFVVETHSEHLMLRLLRYVRTGRISADDIAVLYVHHNEHGAGASVRRIEIDDAGEFVQRWPGGFFTERETELFAGEAPFA